MADRLVVVTGASRGIGLACARAFAAAGERVIAVARDEEALERLAATSPRITAHPGDVTDEATVERLFATVGPVDVLVCSAGVSESAPLGRTSVKQWRRQMDLNAYAVFLCARTALPGMCERDRGRIVTVASTAGLHGSRYTSAYSASKHAAIGLMRSIAGEVAGTGVTSNAVCPSFVRTDMTRASIERIVEKTGRSETEAEQALAAASPLGRLLEPHEIAAAVLYLASEEAAAVNGQALVLDGGGIQH